MVRTVSLVVMGFLMAPWLLAVPVEADEKLKGIACRSVHLAYAAAESDAFYNEVTVGRSAVGTYFAVCGWDKGYFGIQELGNGKKLAIFSVWDSNQNNPKAVADDLRVKLLHKDENVRIGRFGGEGTGGQSFFDYDWKIGATYRFLGTARIDGRRTEYAGYFHAPEEKDWRHLITFSTLTEGKNLRGYYSFVEDFKRDKASTTKAREAHFGNGWIRTINGVWRPLTQARFTADKNPATNVNAAVDGDHFVLATGGETANIGTKLNDVMSRPAPGSQAAPTGLPGFLGKDSK
jgi:hypothetical protein